MLVMGGCHILSTAVALLYILEQSCSYKYDEAVVYRQSLYNTTIIHTRSCAALRAADLDWIVGPGYNLVGYILEKKHEKPTWNYL